MFSTEADLASLKHVQHVQSVQRMSDNSTFSDAFEPLFGVLRATSESSLSAA